MLITSRLLPNELRDLAGCRHDRLDNLAREDVVTFFGQTGVRGTRAEIAEAVAPYGGHPMSISLLARAIVKDPRMRGDIRAAGRHTVLGKLKGKAGHDILAVAYDEMSAKLRRLLGRMAAFRSPMEYEAIAAVGAKGLQLDDALGELEERGLLLREGERYDLHPIVRQYAYDRLSGKAGVHGRLQEYFEARPAPNRVETLEDLTPTIELYWHMVGAGRFDAACMLFYGRLNAHLYFRFGAYERFIELMRGLFVEGDRQLTLSSCSDRARVFNDLANAYSLAGRPAEAVPLFELANSIYENAGQENGLSISLGNLAGMALLPLGRLEEAEKHLRRKIETSGKSSAASWGTAGHLELGRLLAYEGRFAEAESELETAARAFREANMQQEGGVTQAYRVLAALLKNGLFRLFSGAGREVGRLAGWTIVSCTGRFLG